MAVVDLTQETFEDTISNNDFVIVDYWAPWCGPCKSFGPTFEAVSEEHDDIVFAKVNTEVEQQIASSFNIRSIPTLMVFREQIIIFSEAGALPEAGLKALIDQVKELDMNVVRQQMKDAEKEGK